MSEISLKLDLYITKGRRSLFRLQNRTRENISRGDPSVRGALPPPSPSVVIYTIV